MQIYKFSLTEQFSNLGGETDSTFVECFISAPRETYSSEAGKYPCLIICPGGGYSHVSPREAAPIGMNFVSDGYQVFIVRYSTNPHGFPQQLREVAAALEIINEHADEWQCVMDNITNMGFCSMCTNN